MSVPAQTPVRLADARLACGCEFILRPEGDDLSWLPRLADTLIRFAAAELRCEAAVTLVMTADQDGQPQTGLILRLRMDDPYASAPECLAARTLLADKARALLADGPAHQEPLNTEGLFVRLPHCGMRFLRRPMLSGGQPFAGQEQLKLNMAEAVALMQHHPDSGMALTLLAASLTSPERTALESAAAASQAWRALAEETQPLAFTLCVWGSAAPQWTELFNRAGLPVRLYEAAETDDRDPLPGCESQFDPWALHERVRRMLNASGLHSAACRTGAQELCRLLGTPSVPAPAGTGETAADVAASVQQTMQGLLDSLPGLTSRMLESAAQLREGLQKQVTDHVTGRLGTVRQSLQGLSGRLMSVPGVQQAKLDALLSRLQENLSLPEALDAARRAGLDQPLDALALMKMGFSSEAELLEAGLPADTLSLLRAAVAMKELRPVQCGEGYNCMPHAIMLGYLYEALASSCLHRLFVRAKVKRGNGLASYDVVDWAKCEAFAACQAFRSAEMNALTAGDWAVWLNLMACCRLLRNRQHSDKGSFGFIDCAESDAFYDLMFIPGQASKLTMLQLPCNGPCPPEWSKHFEAKIPAEWADAPDAEPCACLREHVRRSTSAFRPSLLHIMLGCASMIPEEAKA